MVLNQNVNPEDDWEILSEEEAEKAVAEEVAAEAQQKTINAEEKQGEETTQSADMAEEQHNETMNLEDEKQENVAKEEAAASNNVEEIVQSETAAPNTKDVDEGVLEPLLSEPTNTNQEHDNSTTSREEQEEEAPVQPDSQATPPPNMENLPAWLRGSLHKIGTVLQEADQKHHLQQKARHSIQLAGDTLHTLGESLEQEARDAKVVIDRESIRLSQTVQQKAHNMDLPGKAQAVEQKAKQAAAVMDVHAKKLGESVKTGATIAGEKIQTGAAVAGAKAKTLNKDGKVTDFLAAAAVVGAGVLLAKGKPGAGAAVLATGGAAYVASEASRAPYRHEEGLNEELHLD